MFTDASTLSVQSESHRADLLADAENFRLARLVRRAGRRGRASPVPEPAPPGPDRPERTVAPRNDDAERRYAVPR
ncbi:hypothetical protein [Pseudonocardia sp. MH-G8]|uniref:hypothetical protein n=1 Tax=Pseudonocardia sp. MH-G8 TaxID=1854588 RepID=UPI000BA06C32|nr:hypothetical protein [Pseudonocardia sp. MH-G8]OZM80478.1 hypothetical protein CFP66_20220 [Pseudonocardia sp. MH-G8]